MVFSSTVFLFCFLPLTLLGYYMIDRRFKNIFLLLASLLFYAWGEPKFVFVMVGSILVNHVLALLIDQNLVRSEELTRYSTGTVYRKKAKRLLVMSVVFNLALFFVYKYLNFTIYNLNRLGALSGVSIFTQTNIALPIGISFFTFQAMSYVFDVYYRKGQVQKNPMGTMLYVSLFPQLIAGPIVRYQTVAQEINNRKETIADFASGIKRFICGLAKKAILSNSLAVIADAAFEQTEFSGLTVTMAWLGALSYSLQIYFDFSGYSDMAIGLGRMFGFHFEENFNYPYCSKSISEFWRRWHISLGTWFRDYVYFPLGGSRVESRKRLVLNLFVVWFLTGVWHGAAWSFIAWGLLYFVLITFEKLTGYPEKLPKQWMRHCYRIFTLLAVGFGWVIFRAPGLKNGLRYIACMFGMMGNDLVNNSTVFLLRQSALLFIIAVIFCVPAAAWLSKKCTDTTRGGGIVHEITVSVIYIAVFIITVAFTVTSTYNPFIYFNF